jgi:hypothetical protein
MSNSPSTYWNTDTRKDHDVRARRPAWIQRTRTCAQQTAADVFVTGCELSAFGNGFIPGETFSDRLQSMATADHFRRGGCGHRQVISVRESAKSFARHHVPQRVPDTISGKVPRLGGRLQPVEHLAGPST